MSRPLPFYTIGHSTRPIDAFVDLLRRGQVQRVIDVRSIPRSRTNPQYNLDSLPDALSHWQIGHVHLPELGGRRSRQESVPPGTNGFWSNQSFHNYADYAMSEDFRVGLDRLLALGSETRSAIMCAEAVWWRCHRRIITDYLLTEAREVYHLLGSDRVEPARLTPGARPQGRIITYPGLEG